MKIVEKVKKLFAKESVIDRVIRLLPDIDPDSTRMVEDIFFLRQKYGLDTEARKHTVHASPVATMDNLLAVIRPYFKNVYSSDRYFRGLLPSDNGEYVELYCVMVYSESGDSSICCVGDRDKVVEITEKLKSTFRRIKSINVDVLTGFGPTGPVTSTYEMSELDIDKPYQEFYPWLNRPIDEFIDEYNSSKANTLLLIGKPGTGKSTLIREMLFRMNRKHIGIVDDSNVQKNPAISSWIREFSRNSMVVFEDADRLVEKRENGNDQMSMLLNVSNGIIQNDTKLIIATNLPSTQKVDPALLRPGRNFDILEFRLLTAAEANNARKVIGKDPLPLDENKQYSLAAALSARSVQDIEKRDESAVGFVTSR